MNIKKESCIRLVNRIIKSPNDFSLFLGAGCSISSGLPDGKSIIEIIQKIVFAENLHASENMFRNESESLIAYVSRLNEFISTRKIDFDEFIRITEQEFSQQDFNDEISNTSDFYGVGISHEDYIQDNLYGIWFEKYSINIRERQKLVEELMEWSNFPSGGYVLLAFLLSRGYFNNIFTTNFDSIIEDTLNFYFNIKPRVFHHSELSKYINLSMSRPNIIKLHGDYLFENIKNLPFEVSFLEKDLEIKLLECINRQHLIVIGFNGADDSIMRAISKIQNKRDVTIYWCSRGDVESLHWKAKNILSIGINAHYVKIDGFDDFMLEIYDSSRLKIKYNILDDVKNRDQKMKNFMKNFHNKRYKRSHKIYNEVYFSPAYSLNSLEELRKAMEMQIKDNDFRVFNDYAIILIKNKEYAEAEFFYKKSIELEPNYINWYNLGTLYVDLLQNEDAIFCYEQSIKLNPNFYKSLNNFAVIYNANKQYETALTLIEQSLQNESDNTNCINKAVILKNMDRVDDALIILNKLEKTTPNDPRLLCNKSNFFRIKGEVENAEIYALKAYSINENDDYIIANLAQVYALMGETDKFYGYLENALELNYPLWKKKNINDIAYNTVKHEKRFKDLVKKYKPAIYQ